MTDIEPTQPPVVVTTVGAGTNPPYSATSGAPGTGGSAAGGAGAGGSAAGAPGTTGTSTGGATTIVYVNPPAAPSAPAIPATPAPSRKSASLLTAYALFFFFGWTGMHQVYLGNTLRGVSYIFTFSWFTIGLWIDLFTLPSQVRRVNAERMLGLR